MTPEAFVKWTYVQGDTSRCAKPPVDFKTKVPLWPGLPWPGQSGTFVLKSTGGFAIIQNIWDVVSSEVHTVT